MRIQSPRVSERIEPATSGGSGQCWPIDRLGDGQIERVRRTATHEIGKASQLSYCWQRTGAPCINRAYGPAPIQFQSNARLDYGNRTFSSPPPVNSAGRAGYHHRAGYNREVERGWCHFRGWRTRIGAEYCGRGWASHYVADTGLDLPAVLHPAFGEPRLTRPQYSRGPATLATRDSASPTIVASRSADRRFC